MYIPVRYTCADILNRHDNTIRVYDQSKKKEKERKKKKKEMGPVINWMYRPQNNA